MGRNLKRRNKWGHYLKKGLELGALGAVQFVPGLDVVADAAVAGEAVAGAEAATGAVEAASAVEDASMLKKGMKLYDKASNYYDKYQEYQGYYDKFTGGSEYRQPPQVSYRGQPPTVTAAAYRQPPKHYLGPVQKKFLIYGSLLLVILIIIAIIARHYIRSCHGCSKSI